MHSLHHLHVVTDTEKRRIRRIGNGADAFVLDMNRRCAVKGNVKIIDFMPKGGGNAAILP